MQHVGSADDHGVDVGVFDRPGDVGRALGEAEVPDRQLGPGRDIVAADHELRVGQPVGEQAGNPGIGPAVGLPHPSKSDDGDADRGSLIVGSDGRGQRVTTPDAEVTGHLGSGSMVDQVSRTQ